MIPMFSFERARFRYADLQSLTLLQFISPLHAFYLPRCELTCVTVI